MNILSDEQHRLLGFIAACNGSSYNPTALEVMLWRQNPEPAKAEYRTVQVEPPLAGIAGMSGLKSSTLAALAGLDQPGSSLQRMLDASLSGQIRSIQESLAAATSRFLTQPTTRRELVKEAETVIDHLIRLTWLETVTFSGKTGLRLTELGRALLHDYEHEAIAQPDVSVVVLESYDPLAYPLLMGQLAEAGEGLLVDAYLKLDSLHRIVISTRLTRLLVSAKPNNRAEVAAMQTYLDSSSLSRRVEVRASTELHDRILLTDDGEVLTLGTSLNGVGRTTTVLTPMPSGAREILRQTYEQFWDNATLVGPQPVEDEDDEEPDEPDEADDEVEVGADDDEADEDDAQETDTDTDENGDQV